MIHPRQIAAFMVNHDPYLDLPLNAHTQDLYLNRTALRQALRAAIPLFSGRFLDIGCGFQPYRSLLTSPPSHITEYVGMDLGTYNARDTRAVRPDVEWDGRTMPLDSGSFDSAMCMEVLEHCPDPAPVLAEAHRVLRPGSAIFITTPFLWPLHDVPYDEYRYTPFSLERVIVNAGFKEVRVRPLGGWDASLAQMIGLWAVRRPMPDWKRRIVKRITLPLVRYLLKHDHVPQLRSGPMITSLSVTAIR